MARTIIEDYLTEDECSHFALAYNMAQRARDIQRRGDARVPENGDKSIVVALREMTEKPMEEEASETALDGAIVDAPSGAIADGDATAVD